MLTNAHSPTDIRTYAVVTLNEECGLIEWVPNTIGLRHILAKHYQNIGIPLYVSFFFSKLAMRHLAEALLFAHRRQRSRWILRRHVPSLAMLRRSLINGCRRSESCAI